MRQGMLLLPQPADGLLPCSASPHPGRLNLLQPLPFFLEPSLLPGQQPHMVQADILQSLQSLASACLAFSLSKSKCFCSGPLTMFLSILFMVQRQQNKILPGTMTDLIKQNGEPDPWLLTGRSVFESCVFLNPQLPSQTKLHYQKTLPC